MKKKLLSTLLCAAMAVSMLAGCGGSDSNAAADNSTASDATETTASADNQASGEDVTIEFWTIDLKAAFGDFFNDMIAQYESENPGVTVNWTDVPYGDIQSKLVTSVAGGAAPDVVNLNTQFTLTLAGQGAKKLQMSRNLFISRISGILPRLVIPYMHSHGMHHRTSCSIIRNYLIRQE